jgi:hypothetical protein
MREVRSVEDAAIAVRDSPISPDHRQLQTTTVCQDALMGR